VLECSGKFRTPETLTAYFQKGVRKVIVAVPVKQDALNVVVGVHDHFCEPDTHDLLTAVDADDRDAASPNPTANGRCNRHASHQPMA
jgi:hypothetical protein